MIGLIRELGHLARRFFGHLSADPLRPAEQDAVRALLPPPLATLFFAQCAADQRHSLTVARRLAELRPDDPDAQVAALLHDVGKSRVAVGPIGRSLATVLGALRLPMPSRWRIYRNHGDIGADALAAAGAPTLAVAFARHHPGPVPPGIDRSAWQALEQADHV